MTSPDVIPVKLVHRHSLGHFVTAHLFIFLFLLATTWLPTPVSESDCMVLQKNLCRSPNHVFFGPCVFLLMNLSYFNIGDMVFARR